MCHYRKCVTLLLYPMFRGIVYIQLKMSRRTMTVFTAIVLLTLFVGTNCCCCFLYLASKLIVAIGILADRSVCLRTLTQERELCESLGIYVQTRSSYCPNRTRKLYCNDIFGCLHGRRLYVRRTSLYNVVFLPRVMHAYNTRDTGTMYIIYLMV